MKVAHRHGLCSTSLLAQPLRSPRGPRNTIIGGLAASRQHMFISSGSGDFKKSVDRHSHADQDI